MLRRMDEECDIDYPGFDDEEDPVEEEEEEEEEEEGVGPVEEMECPPRRLPDGLRLRSMEPRDMGEVKRLHEQCFPVRYDRAFYENVVRGFIVRGKGRQKEPLYTQVAIVPQDDDSQASGEATQDSGTQSAEWPRGGAQQPNIHGLSPGEPRISSCRAKFEDWNQQAGKGSVDDVTANSSCATESISNSRGSDSGSSSCSSSHGNVNGDDADWLRRRSISDCSGEGGSTPGIRRRQSNRQGDQAEHGDGGVRFRNGNSAYGINNGDRYSANHDNDHARDSGHHSDDGPGRVWPPVTRCFDYGSRGIGAVEKETEQIVGLITCQVLPLERCLDRQRLGIQRSSGGFGGDAQPHTEVVYILTLGTETAYRRRGIGRALLRRCVWLSTQEASIGAVYLHVITTNPTAHRFYESEGFVQVCCIDDYYKINGKLYDCFLYALYINGAQPPPIEGWSISSISRSLLDVVSFCRRTLGYELEEGKQAEAASSGASSQASSDVEDDDDQEEERSAEHPTIHSEKRWSDFTPSPRKRRQSDPACVAAISAAAATGAFRKGGRGAVSSADRKGERSVGDEERTAFSRNVLAQGGRYPPSTWDVARGMTAPGLTCIERGEGLDRGASKDNSGLLILGGNRDWRDRPTVILSGATFSGAEIGVSTFGRGQNHEGMMMDGLRGDVTLSATPSSSPTSVQSDSVVHDHYPSPASHVQTKSVWNAASSSEAWRRGKVSIVSTREDAELFEDSVGVVIEIGGSNSDVDNSATDLHSGRCLAWEVGGAAV